MTIFSIKSEDGLKLPALYDEISARVAEQMAEYGGTNGGTDENVELSVRQINIWQLITLHASVSVEEMAERMA